MPYRPRQPVHRAQVQTDLEVQGNGVVDRAFREEQDQVKTMQDQVEEEQTMQEQVVQEQTTQEETAGCAGNQEVRKGEEDKYNV